MDYSKDMCDETNEADKVQDIETADRWLGRGIISQEEYNEIKEALNKEKNNEKS